MSFASPAQRASIKCKFTVQIITANGSEVELSADHCGHALDIQNDWLGRGAIVCEIFRVLHDGTLNPTIGAKGDQTAKTDNWGI